MAVQDLVAGGFYGKLGDMVGQRWKNKRTVRRYVVGANPRTPNQQANRNRFGKSVELAQQAMNINRGAPAWASETAGEFSLRTGTAAKRLGQSLPEGQAVPLFPDGFIPSVTISPIGVHQDEGIVPNGISSTLNIGATARTVTGLLHCFNSKTGQWIDTYYTATVAGSVAFLFPLSLDPWITFPTGSWFEAASNGDVASPQNAIFIPRGAIAEASPVSRYSEFTLISQTTPAGLVVATFTSDVAPWFPVSTILGPADCYFEGELQTVDEIVSWSWIGGNNWQASAPRNSTYQWGEESLFYGIEESIPESWGKFWVTAPQVDWNV